MALVVVAAGGWLEYSHLKKSSCTGSVQLNVAAAPDVAPAVSKAAKNWEQAGANNGGTCIAVNVQAEAPYQVAAAIADYHKVSLDGVGVAPNSIKVPDVWIPDSSTWLMRLTSAAPGFAPTDNQPIAESPVVLAVPQPIAANNFKWPTQKLTWQGLLTAMQTSTTMQVGIVDPQRDASGLSGLLALGQAASGGGDEAKVNAVKALAAGASNISEDLLQRFPTSGDPTTLSTSLTAAPLSEQAVIAYNAQQPAVPLAALYMETPNTMPLDYPYAVMPEVQLATEQAAAAFHVQLRSSAFSAELAAVGLRGPDGSEGTGFQAPTGAPTASPAVTPSASTAGSSGSAATGLDADTLNQALGSWTAITEPGRVLAVFDVSGSMSNPVPNAGNQSRMNVTKAAALRGLELFDSKWAVGMWKFSTDMDGTKPYKQLVPIASLATNTSKLQAQLESLQPKSGGNTGLYATAIAAYKAVQVGWQSGKVNSVILFTDGKNDDDGGMTLAEMQAQFKAAVNPKYPVRMVLIGIGNQVDKTELDQIKTASTYGDVYLVPDPSKIDGVFLEAIGARSGAS